jgi:sulfhydrogenase subunit beta (sulfur reductase)
MVLEDFYVSLKIIQKEEFLKFVRKLLPDYRVVGPVEEEGRVIFSEITDPQDLRMDYSTTVLPPKKYLLPPREALFRFDHTNGVAIEPPPQPQHTIIVGMHTCDLHAFQLLDEVFSSGHLDPNYTARRSRTLLVSIECLSPCDEHAFCKSMETLTADEGYDLHLTDLGDAYAVDIGTIAGRDVLVQRARVSNASSEVMDKLHSVMSEKWPRFPYRLDFDISELPAILDLSMKSPLWNELGERCLACAACTNVCPTCFCFDVKDEINLDLRSGQRVRSWDSCQLDEFATVAGGHNFRASRASRQRHRFLRKGKYILEAHNHLGCVGCGRCARACLVDINPVTVFNELNRQTDVGSKQ